MRQLRSKANNVNPFIWLNDILNRMPEHKANKLEELFLHNWMPVEI